jgi:hypothetical protein
MKHDLRIFYVAILAISISLHIGCNSFAEKPSSALIETEFRHAWYAIHGESGQKGYYNWKLVDFEVKNVKSNGKKADAIIDFHYSVSGSLVAKTGKFTLLKSGDTWVIVDREGKDPSSSTRYQMTP